jgi:hypothetical protein
LRLNGRAGSIPAPGTIYKKKHTLVRTLSSLKHACNT